MRIERQGGNISIRDRPGPFWALGLLLLAGGVIGISFPLGLGGNSAEIELWERVASIVVGIGVSAGALWWLHRNPATQVQLDLTRRRVRLVRSGVLGRQVRWLSFDDLAGVEVERSTDSDGGPICRPAVRLRNGQVVLLSELWSHDEKEVEEGVAVVAEACRLQLKRESTPGRDR